MTFTFIIYTIILFLVVIYGLFVQSYIMHRKIDNLLGAIVVLLIYGLIEGFRFEVGSDWSEYRDYFTSMNRDPIKVENIFGRGLEPLFLVLNIIISIFSSSYQVYFGFIAILHLVLYTLALRRIPQVLGLGMLVYGTGFVLTSQNIMRQTLSTTVFLFGIVFLVNRRYIKYLATGIIASFIHYSSIITLPFVFIGNKCFRLLDNKVVGIIGVVVSFYLGSFLTDIISYFLPFLTDNAKYMKSLENLDVMHEYNSGLGKVFMIFLTILIILNFSKIRKYVRNFDITILYRIFLIGMMLQNSFANSMFLGRVSFALSQTKLFLYPLLFSYFWNKSTSYRLLSLGLITVEIIGFYMAILGSTAGCSPFVFKF